MSTLKIKWREQEIASAPEKISSYQYSEVQIDLSTVDFLESMDLTRARCLIDRLKDLGVKFSILPPIKQAVKDYAGRMGLFEDMDYNYPYHQHVPETFFPLIRVGSDRNDQLFEECQRVLNYSKLSVNYLAPLTEAFIELADNVYYHAGKMQNSGWGYVHAQVYEKGSWFWKKGYIRICVTDIGNGFYGSYERTKQIRNRSETEILVDAFKEGESSLNVNPGRGVRGVGLYEVFKFVKEFSGRIKILSGAAQVSGMQNGLTSLNLPYRVYGTWVELEVPIQ